MEVSCSKPFACNNRGSAFGVELVAWGFPSAVYLSRVVRELLYKGGIYLVHSQRIATAGSFVIKGILSFVCLRVQSVMCVNTHHAVHSYH